MNRKSTVLSVLLATTICFTNIIGSFSVYADDLDNERQAISESKAQYDLLDEQILSLNSEIANINIEQNIFERIISTCKVKIDTDSRSTADETDIEIVLKKDIANEMKEESE